MPRTLLARLLPLLVVVLMGATDDAAFEARVQRVAAELRCLVCQNQSLADSHAPLALDLKQQVREQLRGGRSEADVVAYMTQRYGDFVRYRPAFNASTLLLWGGPALMALAGLALLLRSLSARAGAADDQADAADAGEGERARRLLDGS